ncbi:ABC transporter permease [Streptomyces sp. MP131-18]|uniref:ABC transporter permease n=1 Tax=Streptomyces sp. MP131-18 TaxID=1857892 RepID=UPI00097BE3AA|nr:ABC transporter permease [Streptomyces sp. MP131-18]ONK13779.1 acidobacterial duplicated orphan permease [Streptomyces sp. MP131-18]
MIGVAAVRDRWVSFLGSFVAVALGVAVVTVSGLVLLSGGTGVPERLAGAPVLVRSAVGEQVGGTFREDPPWAPERAEELRRELAGLPGVAAAVADRSFYAQAVGTEQRKGERQGHGWAGAELAAYGLGAGTPPVAADDIVVDRALGFAPGEPVTVLTALGPERFTVSGLLDGPGYYVTDARAAELAGGVRVIGLVPGPGADAAEVAAAARSVVGGEGQVLSGAARDALTPKADAMTRWIGSQVLTAMTVLSAFVAVFIVSSTFAFTVARRRREFGLLRMIGATPRQVRRMVHGEALAVGAVGAAAGALLGTGLAPAMAGVLIEAGFQPPGFTLHPRPWVPAAAFGLGLVVAFAGAWSASRRAARVAPLEAMREAVVDSPAVTRRRWLVGLSASSAGLACAVGTAWASADSMVLLGLGTAMGLTVGLTLLVPALLRPVAGALTRPMARGRGATAMLVRESMLTAVRRTSATVAPVLATVAFTVLITSTVQTTANAGTAERTAAVRAEAAVVPRDTPGLSEAAVAEVAGAAPLSTTVYGGEGRTALSAAGVSPDFEAVYDEPAPGAGTVVITAAVAAAHGWSAGGTAVLTLEDGRTERLRVAAVVDDSLPYQVLLPRDLVRAHDPSALADVAYRTGGAPHRPAPELGAREVPVAEYVRAADAEEDRLVWIFTLILVAMTAGYTAIAVAATLLMATADRAGDLRTLRLSGATARQVLLAVAGETCCVVAFGTALGLAVAAPALLGMVHGLRHGLGLPVELAVAWPWVAGAVAACLLLGLVACVLPARRHLVLARTARR